MAIEVPEKLPLEYTEYRIFLHALSASMKMKHHHLLLSTLHEIMLSLKDLEENGY